jgi:7,8-dihydroneopterin aldolase/epimerase/oxygenase
MTDRIALRDVAVEALVGVHEWERVARRPLTVDIELACDLSAAARSDRLEDTVDYSALVRIVRERCAASSYRLIEALAGDIARACLDAPHVSAAKVTVHKAGAVPDVGDVAVVVERAR